MSTVRPRRCPDCRKQARRVHSTHQRTLNERPLGLRRVVRLQVRRFFCEEKSCSRTTFVEQVPGLSERHRRSSTGLTDWLRSIAIELGGSPAARLCRRLRLTAGRTRLLRLLTAPTVLVPDRAPQVLTVDEFAFRKGCTYGTVLVDVEAGPVVDVLLDRTSETFAAWLSQASRSRHHLPGPGHRPDKARPVGEPSSPDSMTTQPASTPDTITSPLASSSSSVAFAHCPALLCRHMPGLCRLT